MIKATNELRCIFCSKNSDDGPEHVITVEHVIPQMLGGWIAIPILCKKCNNDLGRLSEAQMKQNGYIVTAIDQLKFQTPDKAYNRAEISLKLKNGTVTKGKFTKDRSLELIPTKQSDDSLIVSDKDSKKVLKKQLARIKKESGVSVNNLDEIYDKAPLDVLTLIPGTGVSFIKRGGSTGETTISKLSKPIPFMIPATIALENIAGFSYAFAVQDAFHPLRDWILDDDLDNKVMIHNLPHPPPAPNTLVYRPYHYLKYSMVEDGLVCLVVLFNAIVFSVFMGFKPDLSFLPDQALLDTYIIYDIENSELTTSVPPDEIIAEDKLYMESMYYLANYELRLKGDD